MLIICTCHLLTGILCIIQLNSYGASDGYPSQHGITKDAQVFFLINSGILVIKHFTKKFSYFIISQAALDHLSKRSDIDTSRIVVFGRSLGGAVGAVLTKNNPDKVTPSKLCIYLCGF